MLSPITFHTNNLTLEKSESNILISIFNCRETSDLLHNYEFAAFEFRNFKDRWNTVRNR